MPPFTIVAGQAAPLLQANMDTDVIIRIERLTAPDQTRLGDYAFEMLRFLPDGSENGTFVLNQPRFREAPILLAGANFGCGSSREGAVTALAGRGIKVVIAPSFGDIFHANCFQNGLLPIRLDTATIAALAAEVEVCDMPMTVDLSEQTITTPCGRTIAFDIERRRREALLLGLDDIGQTLRLREAIGAWQAADRIKRPWIWKGALGPSD
ncbi:3-isopropylmalate dehydratase small subunit [Novosphingobium sp. SG707]|uniref:3-isopropylmalate dehydratase small subunit n=1 Tax=Novosphingobium sp. SG707 TaxID=2586996 RepID=UPI001447409E|nr:3-isopropylmalate dehydratase small subunit [Novosphingobium sp. SG707]NKJ00963.1 3-isopropylmalate/(R)-2-methylmalate dehydratase small subunit [Novosphingobium sp. SG707]